ncbi:hypothetical protein [Bradyrhizobium guangdongense]
MSDSVTIKPEGETSSSPILSSADDRIVLADWIPPREGIVPHIRIGSRWVNLLWAIPIGAAALVLLIALAQNLRQLPAVQEFTKHYPGTAQSAPSVDSGFPWWLQLQHFLNMLFMMFIIRAGIQILADHPRLYWNRDCTPGTEWFRFQHSVPPGRIWTAKDDSVTLPDGWESPDYVIRSASPDGGIFPSIFSGF